MSTVPSTSQTAMHETLEGVRNLDGVERRLGILTSATTSGTAVERSFMSVLCWILRCEFYVSPTEA
eukprot:363192-Chlamydomonas_euryale.AAC.20